MGNANAHAQMGSLDSIGGGGIASMLLANGGNSDCLRICADDENGDIRNNATTTLRKDEWIAMDTALVKAARLRQNLVSMLRARGLRLDLTALGLSKATLEWETINDLGDAAMDMDAVTDGGNDSLVFELEGLPLPITHKQFSLTLRHLLVSRSGATPLDTASAESAGFVIGEKIEKTFVNGSSSLSYAGRTLYGLTDFPDRNTGSVTADWASATAAQILADTLAMMQALIDDRMRGPYAIIVPTDTLTNLNDDYSASGASISTIKQRLLGIDGIEEVLFNDHLTSGNVVMLQLTPDVCRIVETLPLQTVQWNERGGTIFNYRGWAVTVPQVRSDQNNRCGVAHYS